MIHSLARFWHTIVALFRDVAWPSGDGSNSQPEISQAQADDVMDATLDDDGMDATGL